MTHRDPRTPRPNPEVKEWEQLIRAGFRDFRQAKSLSERRGYAAILQAKLEAYLNAPAEIADLLPGAQTVQLVPTPPFDSGPSPFSASGITTSAASRFFRTDSGAITALLDDAAIARVDPWSLSVYWVFQLRRRHLTRGETTWHFSDASALARYLGRRVRPSFGTRPEHWVLLDPAGMHGGRETALVYRSRALPRAIEQAETHAEALGIRCLVATVERTIHTH